MKRLIIPQCRKAKQALKSNYNIQMFLKFCDCYCRFRETRRKTITPPAKEKKIHEKKFWGADFKK